MSSDPFVAHRALLFTVAYEMLGSATDAEDVVQETWLRWHAIGEEARDAVRDHRAFLVRMVTRKALDRLRSDARRREDYVGEWLPEPLLTAPDVAEDVELAESLSIAMLEAWSHGVPTLANGASPVLVGQSRRSGGGIWYSDAAEYASDASSDSDAAPTVP